MDSKIVDSDAAHTGKCHHWLDSENLLSLLCRVRIMTVKGFVHETMTCAVQRWEYPHSYISLVCYLWIAEQWIATDV